MLKNLLSQFICFTNKKLCPCNGIGRYMSHCSNWWEDGSGDVLFFRDEYADAFENWARV
ncbi:MAG: hypothetical protein J6P95_01785 [Paludibacteraceae bacterium]|nr:hypothetical protein [Paludibacteraceae bacterium]